MPSFKTLIKNKIEKFSKLLGISDYSFFVNFSNKTAKNDFDVYATVAVDEETREAHLDINKKLLDERPQEIDNTVVHELLHVRFSELCSLISLILKLYVKDSKARKAYEEQIGMAEHKIIVALTEAITRK